MANTPTQKVVTKKHLARVERERRQRRNLLTAAGIVIAIIVLVLAYGLLDQYVLKQNRAVAVVNDERITLQEFQSQVRFTRWQMIQEYQSTLSFAQFFAQDPTFSQQIQSQLQQMAFSLSAQNAPVLGGDVLDAMINDVVIAQEAARRGITVTEAEVEASLQEAFGFYASGTPTPAASPTPFATSTLTALQETLVAPAEVVVDEPVEGEETGVVEEPVVEEELVVEESEAETVPEVEGTPAPTSTPLPTATPYTVEGFRVRLNETLDALKEAGITEDDLRKVIRTQLLRQRLYDEVTADIEAVEEQVWARHILVPDPAVAVIVQERLAAGDDWTALAAEFSTDASNAQNGGDLQWFGRGAMVEEFENVAFSLEVGEISEPVQTRFGYHFIQLLGKEVRPLSADQLNTNRQQFFSQWLEELKASQNIEQFDNWTNDVPTTPALPAGSF